MGESVCFLWVSLLRTVLEAPHFLGAGEKAPCFGTSADPKRPLGSDEDLGVRGALYPLMCDYESNYIPGTALSTFYDSLCLYNNLIKEVLCLSLFLKQGN